MSDLLAYYEWLTGKQSHTLTVGRWRVQTMYEV